MLGVLRRLARRVLAFLRPRRAPQPATGGAIRVPSAPRVWSLPAWLVALRTRLFTSAAAFGTVAFGALTWLVSAGHTAALDLAVAQGVQAVENPLVGGLMTAVSEPGFAPLNVVLVVGTAGALWALGHPLAAGLAVAAGGAAVLAIPLKLLLARPRPEADVVRVASNLPDYSFPSGHTLFYVAFFGFLAYLVYTRLRRGRLRTALLWLLGALIVLVGPSRVYLGHHWPSDVLAAYTLGLAYLVLLVRLHTRQTVGRLAPAVGG
ncbi:MAG TPA: phosphatase PAP2 family protein [Chloroflexota bacterium]|nr:phosphatase PAP2 family protein [Chloroflexota bacterium]